MTDRVPNRLAPSYDAVPPQVKNMQLEAARQAGEGWKIPPPAEAMAIVVDANDRDWVSRRLTAQPLATHQQPLKLTGGIDRIENVTFILAEGYSPSLFPPLYEKTITMACCHDVMLDLLEELTRGGLREENGSACLASLLHFLPR